MMNRNTWLILVLLGIFSVVVVKAEGPTLFHLSSNGLFPKVGEETERTLCLNESETFTNILHGHESITNHSIGLNLKFKSKVLVWDSTNDYAKIGALVTQFEVSSGGRTNQLATPGTSLDATWIAGQWFFHARTGRLTEAGQKCLRTSFLFGPRPDGRSLETSKLLNQSRSIGEKWKIERSADLFWDRMKSWGGSFDAGDKAATEALMKDTEIFMEFVGTTNCFGANCFHLRECVPLKGHYRSATASGQMAGDFILPFDPAPNFYIMKYSALFLVSAGDGTGESYSGRAIVQKEVVSTCRPVPVE
jgi:hypothetical protein